MRGSPFSFSNFSRGINLIDSPYTLQQGEARDCLNVVSSPRGAVKKRTGSTTFASPGQASFPALAVTDNFNRANEKPLSNGGKWVVYGAASNTGEIVSNQWKATKTGEESAAAWSFKEENNPAVSIEVATKPASTSTNFVLSLVCPEGFGGTRDINVHIYNNLAGQAELWKNKLGEKLGEFTNPGGVEAGDSYGLTLRNATIIVWRKRSAGAWTRLFEIVDSTYKKGYGAIATQNEEYRLDNFSLGEMLTGPEALESEALSIGTAVVTEAGVPYLIVQAGKKLVSINAGGEVSTIKEAGITEGKRWSIVQSTESTEAGKPNRVIGGPVYMSNGTDAPLYWKGTEKGTEAKAWTAKAEGEFVEVPKAKYLVYFGNRVWAAGMPAAALEPAGSSAVQFSGFASVAGEGEKPDPTSWPKENIVWFEKEDGGVITGLGIAGAYLLVFKKHKTWAVFDLNEGENRRISDSVGCISHRSIVETPQGTFFLTPDQGVFSTNGSSVREVSRNVRPILQGTVSNEALAANLSQLENASAGYLNGHYYLSYKAKDATWKTLDYDVVLQSWWIHDIAGNQWVQWEPTTGATALYTLPPKAKGGVIKTFVEGVYQDSGSNYTGAKSLTCYWVSPWEPFWQYFQRHRFAQPNPKKRIRELFVDGSGELITKISTKFKSTEETLKGTVDEADMSKPESPLTLGTAPEAKAARYWALGTSRVWSFIFGNNSKEPLEIDSFSVHLNFRRS